MSLFIDKGFSMADPPDNFVDEGYTVCGIYVGYVWLVNYMGQAVDKPAIGTSLLSL